MGIRVLIICPECGVEMEPIETTVEQLPLRDLRLCPKCYLVVWNSDDGLRFEQGIPVPRGSRPPSETLVN